MHTAIWLAVKEQNYEKVAVIAPKMDLATHNESTAVGNWSNVTTLCA